MPKLKMWKFFIIVGCIALLFVTTQRMQSERELKELMQSQGHAAPPSYDAQQSTARMKRAQQLYQLWQARGKSDVTGQVVPFVKDADTSIRHSAVRVLARLETPEAERILTQLLIENQQERVQESRLSLLTLRLALGRIGSRKLRGRERLEAVAKSVDLSWDEIARLSQKVNVHPRSRAVGTPGEEIVREMLDLISVMGRRGEDIRSLTESLTLTPAQQVQLQAASMPLKKAVPFLLDYLSKRKTIRDDYTLTGYLADLGPQSTDMIMQYLSHMPQQASQGMESHGYKLVFRSAALTGDARFIPLLKTFERSSDPLIPHYAKRARVAMEQQAWFPPLP